MKSFNIDGNVFSHLSPACTIELIAAMATAYNVKADTVKTVNNTKLQNIWKLLDADETFWRIHLNASELMPSDIEYFAALHNVVATEVARRQRQASIDLLMEIYHEDIEWSASPENVHTDKWERYCNTCKWVLGFTPTDTTNPMDH